jgi:DNA-binding transcriptional LysR family regulator
MASLNPRQVEAFRAVMLTGGITSAAQLMNVTQPAVSRLIRDLQGALGLKLFERRGARLQPTGEGLSLYQEVERAFVGLDRIAQAANDLRTRRSGTLRVAAYPALATTLLPRFVARFLADRPKLDITIHGLGSRIVLDHVASGQCDLGFASDVVEYPTVDTRKVYAPAAVAVVPSDHRLARKNSLQPQDFRGEPFISLGPFTLLRHRIDFAFAAEEVERQIHVETNLTEIACAMVASGVGVSIVDRLMAEEFTGRGLAIVPFRPRIEVAFVAAHSAQRALSGVAQEFIEGFERVLREFAD